MDTFYIDYLSISMIFTKIDGTYNDYRNLNTVSDPQRYYLSASLSNVVDQVITRTNVSHHFDHWYGTSLPIFSSFYEIFGQESRKHLTIRRNATDENNWNVSNLARLDLNSYLFTFKMRQSEFESQRQIQSQSFYQFISLLGAFWGVLFNFGTWTLRKYIRFQFNKNRIKDLYFYSRTKRASNMTTMGGKETGMGDEPERGRGSTAPQLTADFKFNPRGTMDDDIREQGRFLLEVENVE